MVSRGELGANSAARSLWVPDTGWRPFRDDTRGWISVQRVEGALEAAGVGLLGLRQGLEPVGDLVEAFVAGGLGHARVHVGVLVGLAGDGGLKVVRRAADRQARGGVA